MAKKKAKRPLLKFANLKHAAQWRRRSKADEPEQPKIKTHVTIDAHIYLIARNTGNISSFLNEAAKTFISSKHFKTYVLEWRKEALKKDHERQKRKKRNPE